MLDEGDPNYDSTEDGATLLHQEYSERVRQFKAFVSDCISEYFEAGDIAEVR